MANRILTLTCLSVIYFVPSLSLFAQEKTQWSSFQNGGVNQQVDAELPTQWSPENSIAWQTELEGYGQSSPVIADSTAFVTSVTGDNKESLNIEAFSTADGKRKWLFTHENSSPEPNTVMVSRAAPTPVADADGVITFFEGGNLFALNNSGNVRWKRDLTVEFGDVKARHGIAASLEHNKDHVFLWCERSDSPYVMAIRKSDGETVWKQKGLGNTSWSSPRLIDVGDGQHLVLSSIGLIVGLNPESGERLWEFSEVASNSSSTPVAVGNGKFLMGASGGRGGAKPAPSCGVIAIEKTDEGYSAKWSWVAEKATCSFGSPFAFDGKAYFVNRTGIVNCHDIETGENVYTGRLSSGQIWATPLASKDAIYFFGKGGATSIVAKGNELNIVADNDLWKPEPAEGERRGPPSGSVLYAAAIDGSSLIMRRGDILYCVK